jgi:hypothetical protein
MFLRLTPESNDRLLFNLCNNNLHKIIKNL